MTTFDILIAVDIRGGQSTRLTRADTATATTHGPAVDVIADFASHGAEWIHLADLDAAFGTGSNDSQLAAARQQHTGRLQISGGIVTAEDIARVTKHQPDRIVLSAAALADCTHIKDLARQYPGLLWAGIDVKSDQITARGNPTINLNHLCLGNVFAQLNDAPLGGYIVTDVERDGALTGPPLELLKKALAHAQHPVVASGGVRTADDIVALRDLTPDHSHGHPTNHHLHGTIIGRALYTGSCTVADALNATNPATPRTS